MSGNNQDFHNLSIFRCKLCKYRLDCPIIAVEGLGRICGSCFGKGVYTHARQDLELEGDMFKLYFPCRYQHKGCIFEALFKNTCHHEKRCNLRDRICPLVYEGKCDCFATFDLITHFKSDHKDRVVVSEDYSFTIENPIAGNFDIFYLVEIGLRYFILQIKFDVDQRTYFYAFYYFGNDNDPYTFTLVVENEDFDLILKSVKANHESELNFTINHGLRINQSMLQSICNDKIVFGVNYERPNFKQYTKSFECPICFYYMTDEIHTCFTGHSVCQKCMKKLDKCPTCKSSFVGRNYSMESVIKLFKLPCENSDFCNKYIECSGSKSHAANCFYTTYKCPLAKAKNPCSWKGLYKALITHLRSNHESALYSNRKNSLVVPVYSDIKHTCCFIVDDYVIICSCVVNNFMLSLELHPVLPLYDNQILCTINVAKHSVCKLRGCSLEVSLPYYDRNAMNINNYKSVGRVKLEFSFRSRRVF